MHAAEAVPPDASPAGSRTAGRASRAGHGKTGPHWRGVPLTPPPPLASAVRALRPACATNRRPQGPPRPTPRSPLPGLPPDPPPGGPRRRPCGEKIGPRGLLFSPRPRPASPPFAQVRAPNPWLWGSCGGVARGVAWGPRVQTAPPSPPSPSPPARQPARPPLCHASGSSCAAGHHHPPPGQVMSGQTFATQANDKRIPNLSRSTVGPVQNYGGKGMVTINKGYFTTQ